jgi:hypothetical protein
MIRRQPHLIVLIALFPMSAKAQMLDLSKPMTGPSRYMVNHDGTQAKMGEGAKPDVPPARSEPSSRSHTVRVGYTNRSDITGYRRRR